MAPVSDRFGTGDDGQRDRDRAQLLLIGALSLAIALVAVALVLNSAIYTHNLASRQDSVSEDVVTFTRDVRVGAAEGLDAANRRVGNTGYGAVGNTYVGTVESMEGTVNDRSAVDVAATRVGHAGNSQVRGVRVVDDGGDSFEPSAGSLTDWTVASGVRVRSFTMDVEDPSTGLLATVAPSNVQDFIEDLSGGSDVFTVELVGDTETYRVAVYDDGGPTLTAHRVGSSIYRTCSAPGPGATLDLTGARFGGEACDALSFVDDLSDTYTVRYYNGDLVSGSYELYADVPIDGPGSETGPFTDAVDEVNYGEHCDGPTYATATSSDYPRVVPAYYATDLSLRYQGPDVEFVGTQRVAPGEAGPAPVSPRITSVTATEVGNGDDADFEVEVDVADPNGDLQVVDITLDAPDGDGSASPGVSGRTDTVDVTVQDAVDDTDDNGQEVVVTVTVEDADGNTRTVTQTHTVDNDDTGCPS